MNFVANSLLAVGASPIMARSPKEVAEIAVHSDALALNLGTLEDDTAQALVLAAQAAGAHGVPMVFDPVGVGATAFRRETAAAILKAGGPMVVKGNANEIRALFTHQVGDVTIDGHIEPPEVEDMAKVLAANNHGVVVVSGARDVITDGERVAYVDDGHPMMTLVTAMGCTATAIIGAFLSVNVDPFSASLHAMQVMGEAGRKAAWRSRGNGSMMVNFLDELYALSHGCE